MKYFFKIFSFAKPYKIYIAISLICSFLFVLMNTASLWLISSLLSTILNPNKAGENELAKNKNFIIEYLEQITNNILGNGSSMEQLQMLCLLMLIVYLLKNIFYYFSNVTMNYVNNKMIMDIRNKIFFHIQNLPLSFFHNNKVGEISSITMGDGARMRAAVSDTVNKLTRHPLNILIMLFMLFLINVKMTLYSLIIIPMIGIVVIKIGESIRRKSKRSSKQIAGVTSILHENLSGAEVIKSFGQEKNEISKFKRETIKYFWLIFKKQRLRSIATPINDMIGICIAAFLVWIGGQEVFISKSLDPDDFIKFIVYLFAMFQPAKNLANVNLSIQSSIAAAERVFSILNLKTQKDHDGAIDLKNINNSIKFNNVNFSYNSDNKKILTDINILIPKGEICAIVGQSGAGKSTLINLLPKFYEVTSGEILIDDKKIENINTLSLRNIIGIVSQDTFLFNDTIKKNISFGAKNKNHNEIVEAAKLANANDFIQEFEFGYDTIIGERGVKLSGGQKQRISIARALLKNPPILVLDEATSSLDTKSEHAVQKAIDNLLVDRTVIVIAHRLSTVTNADNIIVLESGKIIESGNHNELINKRGKYKELFDAQFKDKDV